MKIIYGCVLTDYKLYIGKFFDIDNELSAFNPPPDEYVTKIYNKEYYKKQNKSLLYLSFPIDIHIILNELNFYLFYESSTNKYYIIETYNKNNNLTNIYLSQINYEIESLSKDFGFDNKKITYYNEQEISQEQFSYFISNGIKILFLFYYSPLHDNRKFPANKIDFYVVVKYDMVYIDDSISSSYYYKKIILVNNLNRSAFLLKYGFPEYFNITNNFNIKKIYINNVNYFILLKEHREDMFFTSKYTDRKIISINNVIATYL